jgi:hypothetical protein
VREKHRVDNAVALLMPRPPVPITIANSPS